MDCPIEGNMGVPLPHPNDEENPLDMGMNINMMNMSGNIAHDINFNMSSTTTTRTISGTQEAFGLDYLEGNNVELQQQNPHQYNQQQQQQYQQYPTRDQIQMQYELESSTQKQGKAGTRRYNSRSKSNSNVSSSNGSPNSVPIQLTPVSITNNNNNNNPHRNQNPNNENPVPTDEELYQRRKAQNRAAQRAFRERKEGKLKELSNKLQEAEASREMLEKQLNDLKEKNLMLDMENQMLQQQKEQQKLSLNSINNLNSLLMKGSNTPTSTIETNELQEILSFKFPCTSRTDFIDGTIDWGAHGGKREIGTTSMGESYNYENEKVLTISAVWDYLVEFTKLNDDYSVDIPGIMDELRGREVCHGFGPAYPIHLVNDIILRHLESE